jgi:hypothetical protein
MSALTQAIDPKLKRTVGGLKHQQDYGSVLGLGLTGGFVSSQRENGPIQQNHYQRRYAARLENKGSDSLALLLGALQA